MIRLLIGSRACLFLGIYLGIFAVATWTCTRETHLSCRVGNGSHCGLFIAHIRHGELAKSTKCHVLLPQPKQPRKRHQLLRCMQCSPTS